MRKVKFRFLMHMCGKYHVGNDSVDSSSRVKDLCCQISEINH